MGLKALMTREPKMPLGALCDLLADHGRRVSPRATHTVDFDDGLALDLRILRTTASRPGTPLVLCFCGAIDQTERSLPAFQQLKLGEILDEGGTCISIADPSLRCSTELGAAFYQGDAQCPTPTLISALIDGVTDALDSSRLVLTGNSGGAHPALVNAAGRPESIAIVVGPIVNLNNYWRSMMRTYQEVCWPGVGMEALGDHVQLDATPLYRDPPHASVICLANSTDPHVTRQLAPFASAVGDRKKILLIAQCIPGMRGHRYDRIEWANWVTAAARAPEGTIESIVSTFESRQRAAHTEPPSNSPPPQAIEAGESALADRIAEYLRQQGSSS